MSDRRHQVRHGEKGCRGQFCEARRRIYETYCMEYQLSVVVQEWKRRWSCHRFTSREQDTLVSHARSTALWGFRMDNVEPEPIRVLGERFLHTRGRGTGFSVLLWQLRRRIWGPQILERQQVWFKWLIPHIHFWPLYMFCGYLAP